MRHGWDENFRHLANPLDAAQNDDGGDRGEDKAGQGRGDAEARAQAVGDRVGLDHVADAEGGERYQGREDRAEPGQAESLQCVHGPAAHGPGRIGFAVMHRDDDLGKLRTHPQEARDPQPEERPRAADGDRRRDAGDIADTDRRRECGRHRLKGRHAAGAGPLLRNLARGPPAAIVRGSETAPRR